MANLYDLLGVRPDADEGTIKVAFRQLAKTCHPDVNFGDHQTAQQFRQIVAAYDVLRDPERRSQYDREFGIERAWARRPGGPDLRQWAVAIVASAGISGIVTIFCPTFPEHETGAPEASDARALVASKAPDTRARVASVDREIFLGDGGIPPRKIERDHGDQGEASAVPAGDPSAIQASLVAMKAAPVSEGAAPHNRARAGPPRDWATYRDARFAFSLSYPRDVFTGELTPLDDHRRIFLSDDGRAQLVVMARVRTRETIASHRQSIINERYADARFDYTPIRDTWFVLSGTRGGDIFYEHSAFACGGHALLGWQLTYRIAEREFYDRIVQEINHKFRYRGGNESCG